MCRAACFFSRMESRREKTSSTQEVIWNHCSFRMALWPDSSLEIMSMSSMMFMSRWLFWCMMPMNLRARAGLSSTKSSSIRFSRYPTMMVSGVRSSWEALATKSRRIWLVR